MLFGDCYVSMCISRYNVELFSIILHCVCYAQLSYLISQCCYYMLYAVYVCVCCRPHHYAEHKTRPIVTDVTWSVYLFTLLVTPVSPTSG